MYVILQYEHRAHVCKQTTERERVGGMQTEKEEQSSTVVACKSYKRYITWSGTDFIQSQSGDVCTHPCVR